MFRCFRDLIGHQIDIYNITFYIEASKWTQAWSKTKWGLDVKELWNKLICGNYRAAVLFNIVWFVMSLINGLYKKRMKARLFFNRVVFIEKLLFEISFTINIESVDDHSINVTYMNRLIILLVRGCINFFHFIQITTELSIVEFVRIKLCLGKLYHLKTNFVDFIMVSNYLWQHPRNFDKSFIGLQNFL